MPVFRVYETKEDPKEEVVLRLKPLGDGKIALMAVDSYGNPVREGNLLFLTPEGTITRPCNVNKALGVKLDENGRVVIR